MATKELPKFRAINKRYSLSQGPLTIQSSLGGAEWSDGMAGLDPEDVEPRFSEFEAHGFQIVSTEDFPWPTNTPSA